MIGISEQEFAERAEKLKALMRESGIQACLIYGDEYRKENLRYISNYWPLFERGAAIVSLTGDPIVIAAPEGDLLCREMSAWPDIRLLPEFTCVTVPDQIEYPYARYTSLKLIFQELRQTLPLKRIGIVGMNDMPGSLLDSIHRSSEESEFIDAGHLVFKLRMNKSEHEVACLKKAAAIADAGYRLMIEQVRPGMTELELASLAYGECTRLGAEFMPFCVLASGKRVDTIIGRPTGKVIADGDMIMAAIAVQVEGYVSTIGFPFVAGEMSPGQRSFIQTLVEAEQIALSKLKAGVRQSELVQAVKSYFADKNVTEYDLYPPLHGCGLAEAESPYPDEHAAAVFEAGMTVNTDVSLFGHPYGSNRIEESLIVTADGYEPMSMLVRELSAKWQADNR
jgi:Xaa-Pro aminopeptidase